MSHSRRHFIKSGGTVAAALGSLFFPTVTHGVSKIYKGAIIGRTGRGDYGHGLDIVFNGLGNVTVAAVADENPRGRQKAAERSGAERQYSDYREMLEKEKPDIVSIGPRQPDCHRDMALAAIDVGAHIYMEKPITEYPSEADDIVSAAEKKGIRIGIAHVRRLSPEFLALKDALDNELIGTILEVRCYGKQDPRVGGEDLIVLGTHDMDIMRLYFGDPLWCYGSVTQDGRDIRPEDVRKGVSEPYMVAGDTIRAQYAFKNNIHFYWSSVRTNDHWNESSRFKGDPLSREKWGLEFFGTNGNIVYRSGYGIKFLGSPYLDPADSSISWKEIPGLSQGSLPAHKTHPIKNLIHAIETGTQPACSARDARWAVEMVSAPYLSQIKKKRVNFPLNERDHPLSNWK